MNGILSKIKSNWVQLAKFGVFLTGIVTLLLVPPPIEWTNKNTVRFLMTILTAFMIAPLTLFNKHSHFRFWLLISTVFFLLGVFLFVRYNNYSSSYVVEFEKNNIVIGKTFNAEASKIIEELSQEEGEDLADGSPEHNRRLLSYVGGSADQIWSHQTITKNKNQLVIYFYGTITTIALLILSLFQTLQILSQDKRHVDATP